MPQRVVVITGATSGIGEVAADRLAGSGARIVFVARNSARGETTLKRLRAIAQDREHRVFYADLSRLSEMKRVAAEIAAAEPSIDVLVNNAGALFGSRIVTEDGFEKTFALNHLSYFVLTSLLRPCLTPGGRVVSTASDAHKGAHLDFNDLQGARGYSGYGAYGRSKLCNILFTRELARRLAGTGVTANCLHPGFVATRFGDESGGMLSLGIRAAKTIAIAPEQGAQTIVYLASSPDVANVTGKYFYKCRVASPTREAQDDDAARQLWDVSAKMTGVGA